jgi:hypothetical protein
VSSDLLLCIVAFIILMLIAYRYYILPRTQDRIRKRTKTGTMSNDIDSPEAGDNFGHTALHYAAERGDLDKCRALIAGGADVNAQGGGNWGTPLHWAMRSASCEVCALLIESGADVNSTCGGGPGGATPLDELDSCIELGRNPDRHSYRPGSGVESALIPSYRKIEELLTRHGARRNM